VTLPSPPWLGRRSTWVAVSVAGVLSAPAILSFGMHMLEHAVPLGVFRSSTGGLAAPTWAGRLVIEAALHCAAPTWLAIGIALVTAGAGRLKWLGRSALLLLAASAYVSMTGITAIVHSCWGEAPHFPWCVFGLYW
jgi:hypothetical protein